MASIDSFAPTRSIHTLKYYQMILALIVFLVVAYIEFLLCSGGKWGMAILPALLGSCIPALIVAARTLQRIVTLRRGKISAPNLFEFHGNRREREYNHICLMVKAFLVVAFLSMMVLVVAIMHQKITGMGAIIATIAFNIYGWFVYSWFQEAFGMIVSYRDYRNGISPTGSAETMPTDTEQPEKLRYRQ